MHCCLWPLPRPCPLRVHSCHPVPRPSELPQLLRVSGSVPWAPCSPCLLRPPCSGRRRPVSVCLATSEPETSRPSSRAGHPLGLETASGIGFLGGLRGAVGTQGQSGRPGSPGSARERRQRRREAWACVTRRLPAARTSCWGHRCCRAEPAVHFTAPGPQSRYVCGWGSRFTVSRCYREHR